MMVIKKISVALVVTVLLLCTVFINVGAEAAEYDSEELSFTLPEYLIEYDFSSLSDSWITDDASILFILSQIYNTDGVTFRDMEIQNVQQYYNDLLSSFPESYSITESKSEHNACGYPVTLLKGFYYESDEKFPLEICLFSTDENVYSMEFITFSDTDYKPAEEVINSIYIDITYYDDDYSFSDSSLLGLAGVFTPVIMAIVGFVFKSLFGGSKGSKGAGKSNENKGLDFSGVRHSIKKIELNGKTIRVLNKKFTGGNDDDNFALNELERERREREKMYD